MEKKMNARKKAQRAARLRKQRNRRIALTLCLMFVVAFASIGGTIAWLTAKSGEVKNTFTVGNINIELKEHDYVASTGKLDTSKTVTEEKDYKMVPGNTLPKDPFVTIKANSESSWLFVEVVESENLDTFISYTVDDSKWEAVTGATGKHGGTVYAYKNEVPATGTADSNPYYILTSNQVTVNNTVKKSDMDGLTTESAYPTLTFYAYAVQSANVANAATAWSYVE